MAKIGNIDLGKFPILLAPMEDITDPPFRALCKEMGADVMYTEFISVEGLVRDARKSLVKLDIDETERPVGIQIFGAEVENMARAAQMIASLEIKPDILDINFGCPVSKVAGKGAGSGILRDIPRMLQITKAVVESAGDIPVTVKTRLGWDSSSICIEDIAEPLQDCGIQALTIHGRTRCQMYKGQANWNHIRAVKQNPRIHIPIFGNGDVTSPELAKVMRDDYGLDGCMIGRAAIGYPWIFSQVKYFLNTGEHLPEPDISQRVYAAKKHLEKAILWKGERLGILETRKHYGGYFKGIDNFKPYRLRLCTSDSVDEIFGVFEEILNVFY